MILPTHHVASTPRPPPATLTNQTPRPLPAIFGYPEHTTLLQCFEVGQRVPREEKTGSGGSPLVRPPPRDYRAGTCLQVRTDQGCVFGRVYIPGIPLGYLGIYPSVTNAHQVWCPGTREYTPFCYNTNVQVVLISRDKVVEGIHVYRITRVMR